MAQDLTLHLAANGWTVRVITGFPMMPEWEVYRGYQGRIRMGESLGGVQVFRRWVYVPQRPKAGLMRSWRRIAMDTSFLISSLPTLLGSEHQDVVVAIGPPLQGALGAMLLKKRFGCPFVYWLQDIVPDAAASVGMMNTDSLTFRFGRYLERLVYSAADRIGIITPGFRGNLLNKSVPGHKIDYLPNWADLDRFDGYPGCIDRRGELNLPREAFVIVHAGSVGAKQAMENAVRAMEQLQSDETIHLVVLGSGNRLDSVKAETRNRRLSNVHFVPTKTGTEYLDWLRTADLLLLNQSADVKDVLIPSKLLTYMPSDRPIVAAVHSDSEAARLIQRSGCGIVVPPEQPDALAEAIRRLSSDDVARRQMGHAGKEFIRRHFSKDLLLSRFEQALSRLASDGRAGPTLLAGESELSLGGE